MAAHSTLLPVREKGWWRGFANLLGSPNVLTAGHFCYGPRIATSIITCGTNPIVDYENDPRCIMVWGNNLVISNPDCYKGEPFSVSLNKGAKLIVVDPRLTRAAARAVPGAPDVDHRAGTLGVEEDVTFTKGFIRDVWLDELPHVVLSLHACDTATDDALARGRAGRRDARRRIHCGQGRSHRPDLEPDGARGRGRRARRDAGARRRRAFDRVGAARHAVRRDHRATGTGRGAARHAADRVSVGARR